MFKDLSDRILLRVLLLLLGKNMEDSKKTECTNNSEVKPLSNIEDGNSLPALVVVRNISLS